jgi:hypothetical protein
LKPEPSISSSSLRAVALAITLVSVVTFSSVLYSAYADFNGIVNNVQTGSHNITVTPVTSGNSATLYVNATIPNDGLFPLTVSITCSSVQPGITCNQASITVPPKLAGELKFQVAVADVSELQNGLSGLHVNGTITAELVPFASISATIDVGSFLRQGGG